MNRITKTELIEAKDYLLSLKLKEYANQRIILPGSNNILLTGNKILTSLQRRKTDKKQIANCKSPTLLPIIERGTNFSCYEYLGAILYLLHLKTGCHIMYGLHQISDRDHKWKDHNPLTNYFHDQTIINYIKTHGIDCLLKLNLTNDKDNDINNELTTTEFNSSFNYRGLTNYSGYICEIAKDYHFKVKREFSEEPDPELFKTTGTKFSDPQINKAKNQFVIKIGELNDRDLTPDEIWPHTMEALFKINNIRNYEQLFRIYNILERHILFSEKVIQEKGPELAFRP